MSFNYAKTQALASRLLKKFGRPITIQVKTGEVFDVATQTNIPSYTDSTGNGVTLNFDNKEIDGSLILTTDIKLLIENIDLEPVVDSIATIDGVTYRVVPIRLLKPATQNVFYTVGLRV